MDDNRKVGRRYLIFFGVICVVFIGILGMAYRLTRRANPVMLDEHGKVSTTR
jgi:CHASE3 domain sensor protein